MNILVSTFRYFSLTGTETFTYSLLKALAGQKKLKIYFYAPFMGGEILKQTKKLNHIFIYDNPEDLAKEKIDVIHVHHNLTAVLLRYYFPETPMVYFMHGCLPFLEQPPEFIKFNYYGALSPEIDSYLKKAGIPENKRFLFPNSIDTSRFSPKQSLPIWPKKILVLSNYINRQGRQITIKAAHRLGLKVIFIGRNKQTFFVEKHIHKASMVMTLGRGAIEAAGCGRAVIVFSYDGNLYRAGDGMLTPKNINKIALSNFSGRALRIPFTVDNLVKEFQKYDRNMGQFNRQYVLAHYDMEKNFHMLMQKYALSYGEKAGSYDKNMVGFIAKGLMETLRFEKLVYRYRSLNQLLFTRFKDQLIHR